MMNMKEHNKPFYTALRRIGFKREWKSIGGGATTIQYGRGDIRDLRIEVQFWSEHNDCHDIPGTMRASRWIGSRSFEYPIEFTTVDEMCAAISLLEVRP